MDVLTTYSAVRNNYLVISLKEGVEAHYLKNKTKQKKKPQTMVVLSDSSVQTGIKFPRIFWHTSVKIYNLLLFYPWHHLIQRQPNMKNNTCLF